MPLHEISDDIQLSSDLVSIFSKFRTICVEINCYQEKFKKSLNMANLIKKN